MLPGPSRRPDDGQPLRLASTTPDPRRPGRPIEASRLRPGDRLISGRVVLSVGYADPDLVVVVAVGAGQKWRHTWKRSTLVRVIRATSDDE